jgi:acyl dehydratase
MSGLSTDLAGLPGLTGKTVGYSEWTEITQAEVNAFADLTNDHNPLHVDPERAKATPFGGTIAHGFLTLSLVAPITQRLQVTDAKMAVNYGLDKVRFPAPLPVGKNWRGNAEITEVSQIKGGLQVRMNATVEVQDSERPAVVAESLVRFYA